MSYQLKCKDVDLMIKACEYYQSFAKDNELVRKEYDRVINHLRAYSDQNLDCLV